MGKPTIEERDELTSRRNPKRKLRGHEVLPGDILEREWRSSVAHMRIPRRLQMVVKFRPIIAFERKSGTVWRYPSVVEAGADFAAKGKSSSKGTASCLISLALHGHHASAMGCIWRHDKEAMYRSTVGVLERVREWQDGIVLKNRRRECLRNVQHKPMIGFSINDDSVVRYASNVEAARDMVRRGLASGDAVAATMISMALSGEKFSAYGYVWRIDLQAVRLPNDQLREARESFPLVAIPFDGRPEIRYPNLTAAAEAVVAEGKSKNVATARVSISRVCNGHKWSAFGCDWKIAES